MVKTKKNFVKKQTTETTDLANAVDDDAVAENDYDSMIENGTSEESDNEAPKAPEEDESDGDDGFSEQEVEEAPTKKLATATLKRKTDVNSAKSHHAAPVLPNESKKPKPNVAEREKVKPPTLEEINELKETRNLFHSNLFRLQVKEMLGELRIKDKYTKYISAWSEQFKGFVMKLKSAPEKSDAAQLQWLQQSQLQLPLALKKLHVVAEKQKPFQFQFVRPTTEPFLIGAASTQSLLGPKLTADICLVMPAACFQKENFLNLVYEQKRALYLTYIADRMLRSKQFEGLDAKHLHFNYYANDPLKPVLEITPPPAIGGVANKLTIRLFVAAEESSFKLSRFVPWNNNIRASLFEDDEEEAETEQSAPPHATPHYNAGVLFDLTMERNQRALHATFEAHKNLQEGLVLLKVWLRQRELNVGYSGVHGHLLAMFVVWLVKERKLHANMSSYQVARTVWNQLAHSAWDESGKGISLGPVENVTPSQPTLEQFHAHYDVVFVDVTGFHNICANLTLEMYRRVRAEAKLAVDMLNDMKLNSFQLIFMTKCPLYAQFDHILKINKDDIIEQILDLHVTPADKCNYAGYAYPQLLKVVTSLLRKGLGQRVHTLLPIEQATEAWSTNDQSPGCATHLHLGIILNPEHAYEVLDKGPESIAAEAQEFRKFWGDKAQLRRFQDGSITESVVWAASTDPLTKRRLVVRSIVLHLLRQHFQLEATDVEYIAGELDVVYHLTSAFKTDKLYEKCKVEQDTNAEAMSLPVIRAFDDLARKLSGLSELPLEITSIAGISPVFRYCEPTPVLPQARCINGQFYAGQVLRGVIQLGLSGKWPSELGAMRALKTAFYLQIAQLLRDKHKLRTKVSYDGVLVLKQGYCFSIELAHPKEVALLKREKTERGITQYVDCPSSIALQKRHYILPKLTGALHALYQLHPSFGGAAMIAKRWLHTQLIDDGLWSDECTELLIASQYLKTHAQQVTCSPQTGFFRFLQLLAHSDWRSELFLLNFNNAMNEGEVSALEQRFNAERDTFPPLCIATAYDQQHHGLLWSSNDQPNVNVLARVTILARQALAIIEPTLLSSTESFIKPAKIFTASSQGYDLVIQLKPDIVPNTLAFEFGSPFAALDKPNWRLPLADTDFLKDAVTKLREAYSDFAAFFYNPCGGKEIGVIWKPNTFTAKQFKVTEVNGCNLSSDGKHVQCQKETLIEDFKFILKDFYLRVDTVEAVLKASIVTATISRKPSTKRYFMQPPPHDAGSAVKKETPTRVPKRQEKSQIKLGNSMKPNETDKAIKQLGKLKRTIQANTNKSAKSKKIVKTKSVKKVKKAT